MTTNPLLSILLCASTQDHGPHVWVFEDRGARRCPGLSLYASSQPYDAARAPFSYNPMPLPQSIIEDAALSVIMAEETAQPAPEPVQSTPEPTQAPEPSYTYTEPASSASDSYSSGSSSSDSYGSSDSSSYSSGSDY